MFFFCISSSITAFCDNKAINAREEIKKTEKLYVTADQLWIDENGMFVNLAGNVQPITAIFRDTMGLYVTSNDLIDDNWTPQYQCPNGHPSPHGDGKCNQKKAGCPYGR
jgi:hypothetical protein